MKITKQRLKEIIKEEIQSLRTKEVDLDSLEIEGIDHSDHPDYVDAYFSYGIYADGIEMTDIELETFKEDNPDLFYQKLNEFLY
jgi:gamma-glutamylcysteine synthetase